MRALDLFSGIGGFALAGEWVGIRTVAFCEIDPYCRRILSRHWPDVPIYEDIRELTRERMEQDGVMQDGAIDIVWGGFPCQPFSVAGKRRGKMDDRNLWPEMARIVSEVRPDWVVGENVVGITNLALDDILFDLESLNYTCRTFIIPACAVGAPHRRDRVFIVAYSSRQLPHGSGEAGRGRTESPNGGQNVADTIHSGIQRRSEIRNSQGERSRDHQHPERRSESHSRENSAAQSGMGGGIARLSDWLDRTRWPAAFGEEQYDWEPPRVAGGKKNRVARLKALGNAVVPHQVAPILMAIKEIHDGMME